MTRIDPPHMICNVQ